MKTIPHSFPSDQSVCSADLFLPATTRKPPVVLLAQGYAAERGFGTQGIIRALVEAGMAVFAFDYRGFGQSAEIRGCPRQLVDPWRQLEDWRAALDFLPALQTVDASRIGLWGSSFAGGHVIAVAGSDWSRSLPIKAVVSQVPHCDSRSAFRQAGIRKALAGAWHGIKGAVLARLGKTHTVPVVGKPDDVHFSVMQHPGWYEGYMRIARDAAHWQNAIPAQSLLKAAGYNPIDFADKVPVPVLMVYGAQDQGIARADVEATAQRIPLVETCCFAGDHFDVYDGGNCQQDVVARQVGFFGRYLGG